MQSAADTLVPINFNHAHQFVNVLDSKMAYIDVGTSNGSPVVVFLHGNPTSSYLWRNIIPHVSSKARCLAPDLIGMGRSGKPSNCEYRFADQASYLKAFLDIVLPSGKIILVLHDWGSALGLDFACQNKDRISGLVLMEFLRPWPTWDSFTTDTQLQNIFRAFRSTDTGRTLLIEQNAFIEVVLQAGMARQLTDEEMKQYRAPFLEPASREPLYRFPNELPIEKEPSDVWYIAERYHAWLLETSVPKLFFWASPGGLILEDQAKWYSEVLKNTKSVPIGEGRHYVQEDQPEAIGSGIAAWLTTLG